MDQQTFATADLPTAALLLATTTIKFYGLDGSQPRRVSFLFAPKKRAEQIALDFQAGQSMINARAYADSMRRAKDIIFEAERSCRTQKG